MLRNTSQRTEPRSSSRPQNLFVEEYEKAEGHGTPGIGVYGGFNAVF